MRGRTPFAYRLREAARQYLHEILPEGQLIQRVANRARALLTPDRGAKHGVARRDESRMGSDAPPSTAIEGVIAGWTPARRGSALC